MAVAVAPRSVVTVAVVVALGAAFAFVGLLSHLRAEQISCACFGSSRHRLGLRQIAVLPLWLVAATGPAVLGTELDGRQGLLALAGVTTAVAVASAVPVLRLARAGHAEARRATP